MCTLLARICWGRSASFLFTVLCFKWSVKKSCVARILQGILERFLYDNNCNCNSYKFSYKFAFIPVLSFRRNQKQELKFQQVGDLVTINISAFSLLRVALYCKGIPNSIDFYKKIFWHVIPVRIIVPWLELSETPVKANSDKN